MSHDTEAARELWLYISSDGALYRQQTAPILKNLATKMARGIYDKDKAVKLWGYLMDTGAKKYAREFSSPGDWNHIFSVATRKEVARQFNEDFLAEYALGNFRRLLPKKYQR